LFLALAAGLAAFVYWPGLQGGFLFDDFYNLDKLGQHGGVVDWESLRMFLLSGDSGPAGRPLSLLTFLLDDNDWPSRAPWFKQTNLMIHVLCGLLLCWCTLRLLRNYPFGENEAQWIAVFSSACWLLHPLMVSTTLYVVQRMAQLATLFVLAGMTAYLHGRSLLPARPRAAYAWMSVAVGLGTILAVLCKENGALLPVLVLVVEFCLPRSNARPARLWSAIFLLLPSLAILGYLASLINFSPDAWPRRPFNQPERLWSEARILWEYLRLLFIPQIEGQGLFQDGFNISKGWLTPWTTLPAAAGLLGLFCAGLWMRRRQPLAALAILFFFGGHLIESSVVGLELYFEHRNYLSAAFLFLPLGQGLAFLARRFNPSLAGLAGGLILCLLAWTTWQRAQLWQNPGRLIAYWATANPNSARAQNQVAAMLILAGRDDEVMAHFQKSIERLPHDALLNLNFLIHKINTRQASREDFAATVQRLVRQAYDAQASQGLIMLVDKTTQPGSPPFYRDAMFEFLDVLDQSANFSRVPSHKVFSLLSRARLYLARSEPVAACQHFKQAVSLLRNNVEPVLGVTAEMASGNLLDCALSALDSAENVLRQQSDRTLLRPRERYESEILRLRGIIEQEKERQK
jgi:tetratricopeptide (TPR) repeat protein